MKIDTCKIYQVEFIRYTNVLKNTVRHNEKEMDFIHVEHPFLVREEDLEKFRHYGGGYNSIKYVGNLVTEE